MDDTPSKAIKILRKTHDGDKLAPEHLHLLQAAVNNNLTETGLKAFYEIYNAVINNQYQIPWLHNIKDLIIKHDAYSFTKTPPNERHNLPLSQNSINSLKTLGKTCEHLENIGVPITINTTIWYASWFNEINSDNPYLDILREIPGLYIRKNNLAIIFKHGIALQQNDEWTIIRDIDELTQLINQNAHKKATDESNDVQMRRNGFDIASTGQNNNQGIHHATGLEITTLLKHHKVPTNITKAIAKQYAKRISETMALRKVLA